MRVVVGASALALAMSVATPAVADGGLELTWTAPEGCPSASDVRAAALRSAGTVSEPVVADATVTLDGTTWRVRLQMRGRSRDIEGPTCAGVADATAAVLSLALVPPGSAPAPPAPPPPPVAPPPPPAPPSPHHLAVGVAAMGALGALPAFGAGGAFDAAWTPGRGRLELEASRLGSQSPQVSGKTAGASISVTRLGGRGCFAVVRRASFDLAPCAGVDAQIVSADGFNTDDDQKTTTVWASLAGGGLARALVASWLAIRLRVEADAPLARPRFVVQGQGLVFRPPTVGAAAFLGAEVLFL